MDNSGQEAAAAGALLVEVLEEPSEELLDDEPLPDEESLPAEELSLFDSLLALSLATPPPPERLSVR
ncbi:hypothetical protein [Pseudonocardia aurantiaca]|uniref:hypothetical protein n=1 Tax=Pseudonocardia aurantiaca TaxID=75290 RepID=UPI0031D48CCC